MRRFFSLTMLLLAVGLGIQAQQATVRIDAQTKHQRITGFGGFVCSPQFTYNHMSTAEIKKVWGKSSTVGCNIMRLYIPVGRVIKYGGISSQSSIRRLMYFWTLPLNLPFDSLSALVNTMENGTPFSPSHWINSRSIFCGS